MTEKLEQIKALVSSLEAFIAEFQSNAKEYPYEKYLDARKATQELKLLAQGLREDILEKRKNA